MFADLSPLMAHPAINLDLKGLARTTGLDISNARRIRSGTLKHADKAGGPFNYFGHKEHAALQAWAQQRIAEDPDGAKRGAMPFVAWVERWKGSNPPPWLSYGRPEPKAQNPREVAPRVPGGRPPLVVEHRRIEPRGAIVLEDRRPSRFT